MNLPPFDYLSFYKEYNLDYWASKIALLKNSYEHFDKIKEYIHLELSEPDDEKTMLMLKTDLHYLYFQMVEALFELIFALQYRDDKNIWYYISFSGKNNYKKMSEINLSTSKLFDDKITLMNPKDKTTIKISFLRYVFFHIMDLEKLGIPEEENLVVIKKLLKKFASDFSDRNEYNAFKHSLRMTYEKPSPMIKTADGKHSFIFEGDNAFNYLEKYEDDSKIGLSLVTKCFFPKLDLLLCKYCSWLIHNIITTRKNSYFKMNEPILSFETININEIYNIPEKLGRMVQTFSINK